MAGEEFYIRDPIRPGMCGEDIRVLQDLLTRVGYDVPTNGFYDPQTQAAAEDFRIEMRLEEFDRIQADPETPLLRLSPPDHDSSGSMSQDDFQNRLRADSPRDFPSRDEYEEYLRGPPSPFVEGEWGADEWANATLYTNIKGLGPAPIPMQFKSNEEKPPPGSAFCLIARNGTDSSITDLPLFDEVRKQLPANIGDDRAAQATLSAMQDGIRTPDQLDQVVVANDKIFVEGNIPGFRGLVDLSQPAPSPQELATQFAELETQHRTLSVEQQVTRGHALG